MNYTGAGADTKYGGGATEYSQAIHRVVLGFTDQADIGHDFSIYGKVGLVYNHLRLDLYSNNVKQVSVPDGFWSMGWMIEPGIQYNHSWGKLQGRVQLGYELSHQQQPTVDNNSALFLQDQNGKDITLDWHSIRLGFSLGFKL